MYKIILNEHDFLTYDVILKDGDNIITKDEGLNDTVAESCILSLYHSYNLPKNTKMVNYMYEGEELKSIYRMTLKEFLELWVD